MVEVGWLDTTSGGIALPDFEKHNSETAKQRALTAIRVRRHHNAPIATKALPEKRREEKSKKKPPTPFLIEIPENLKTTEFIEVWKVWVKERSKGPTGKRITEEGARRQLNRLSRMVASGEITVADAADGVSTAIEGNWQGLVYERMGKHSSGKVVQRGDRRVYE